jgi:selenocysteine-specific elongation factor
MRVIATAGHVDHGKSTLVLALTGVDTDRWPEEKTRGLTIDLGFASMTLPSGQTVGFVDVPGHARFVKNMLAGVGAVDACLFVVAATEGWKPQSEEHLRILELLGISRGLVALTKIGLVDDDWHELVRLTVQEHLAGTFLEQAPLVSVDVPAGIGLPELTDALDRLVASTPGAVDRDRPRLWIDRSFPMRGAGTIITGTLADGSLSLGDELVVEPGHYRVRVRGLQSHYESLDRVGPGCRLAVNLTGISHHQAVRGQALVRPGQWHMTTVFDATLSVLGSIGHPLSRRGAYVAHIGSGDFPVRLQLIGGATRVEPGHQAPVRLRLTGTTGLPLMPGDRFVLRESGRSETVGGGEVLDVEPVLPARRAAPSRSVERVVRERGWVDVTELARLTGETVSPKVDHWVAEPEVLVSIRDEIVESCRVAGSRGLDLAGFDEKQRAVLGLGISGITIHGDRVVADSETKDDLSEDARQIRAQLEATPLSPPAFEMKHRGALRELERRGEAVEVGDAWFASSAVAAAIDIVAGLLSHKPEGFTVSEARDALGTTRKHAVPLLGHLDSIGVTRRRGDLRVAGPRLPAVGTPEGHR